METYGKCEAPSPGSLFEGSVGLLGVHHNLRKLQDAPMNFFSRTTGYSAEEYKEVQNHLKNIYNDVCVL